GLELSQEKTKITHIADGFDFLGQNIRKYNGLLLTRPSKKNVKAFLKDIRETIKGHKQATAYGLIALLNPKIQGWANYHRYSAASKTFHYVDWSSRKQYGNGQNGGTHRRAHAGFRSGIFAKSGIDTGASLVQQNQKTVKPSRKCCAWPLQH